MGCCESKPPSSHLAGWMGELGAARDLPLHTLAIPGTHDSGTCDLTPWKGISPDEPDDVRTKMSIGCWLGCCLFTSFFLKWSRCQQLDIGQQLAAGVRFLDLRVASHQSRCCCGKDSLRLVHGFYGREIGECLLDVKEFLDAHPGEVVLLDFNHFYRMEPRHHGQLARCLKDTFGATLCEFSPSVSFDELTLNELCRKGTRVIVFYHGHGADDLPEDCCGFWPSSTIDSRSSWARTTDFETWKQRQRSLTPLRHSSADRFYVCQGVLTPDSALIGKNWFYTLCCCGRKGTLKTECADRISGQLQDWIVNDAAPCAKRVIYVADYVDEKFVRCVIEQNRRADK